MRTIVVMVNVLMRIDDDDDGGDGRSRGGSWHTSLCVELSAQPLSHRPLCHRRYHHHCPQPHRRHS